jgi:hypothetical protein
VGVLSGTGAASERENPGGRAVEERKARLLVKGGVLRMVQAERRVTVTLVGHEVVAVEV